MTKSTHRERRARVNRDAIEDALLDHDQYWWILNESPTVDYVDYDTEMRAARDAVPYIVDGGTKRDFYSCGCCSDLDQFDVAHSSREGERIKTARSEVSLQESTDVHAKIISFLVEEFARKEGQQCVWLDLLHSSDGFHEEIVHSWQCDEGSELFSDDQASNEQRAATIVEVAALHAAGFGQRTDLLALQTIQKATVHYVVRTRQYLGGRARLRFKMPLFSSRDLAAQLPDDQRVAIDLVLEVGVLTSDTDDRFLKLVPNVQRREYLKKLATLLQIDQGVGHVGPTAHGCATVVEDQAREARPKLVR